jgi:hypothetical protein
MNMMDYDLDYDFNSSCYPESVKAVHKLKLIGNSYPWTGFQMENFR